MFYEKEKNWQELISDAQGLVEQYLQDKQEGTLCELVKCVRYAYVHCNTLAKGDENDAVICDLVNHQCIKRVPHMTPKRRQYRLLPKNTDHLKIAVQRVFLDFNGEVVQKLARQVYKAVFGVENNWQAMGYMQCVPRRNTSEFVRDVGFKNLIKNQRAPFLGRRKEKMRPPRPWRPFIPPPGWKS